MADNHQSAGLPDFDQIAAALLESIDPYCTLTDDGLDVQALTVIAAQLRQVWNARGAADIDAIESPFMGLGPFYEKVRRAAILKVDR